MQSAEKFSLAVATPLDWIATMLRPVIWLLGASVNVVMRLLGRDPNAQKEEMGTEELRSLVAQHESLGVAGAGHGRRTCCRWASARSRRS